MWRFRLVKVVTLGAALALAVAGSALGQDKPATKPAQKPMPQAKTEAKASGMSDKAMSDQNWYLIISPHTAEECLTALDEVQAKGAGTLGQWDWGCKAGDHVGYSKVHAKSAEEALMSVPADLRSKAKAVAINKFTEADLKSFHEMMKH